jgi:LysM repeat protein
LTGIFTMPIIHADIGEKGPLQKESAMKRTGFGPAAAVAAIVALTFMMTVPQTAVASQKTHVVQRGDTLWDISSTYLYDPFLWPQVWSANRDIENPHLIFPGQEIQIPSDVIRRPLPPSVAKPALPPPPTEPAAEPAAEAEPEPEPVAEEVKQEMIMALSTYGFIIDEEEIGLGTLTSTEERRLLIRPGMKVYITTPEDSPLTLDGRYSIVRIFNEVIHPVTKKEMGYLARVLGDITIVESREGLSSAMVEDIYNEAKVGDHIIEHIDYLSWLPDSGPGQPLNLEGYILINPEGKTLLGKQDIVFIDLGSNDGLATGDLLTLVAGRSTEGGVQLPEEPVGELKIIVSRPETSVARIVESIRDIRPGTKAISKDE